MEFDIEKGIAVLERTPATLRSLLNGLPDEWTSAREGPETWSPKEVVAHLIFGERTDWIPRARIILARGPSIRFVPFDRAGHFAESRTKTLRELLDELERLRAENVATLRAWKLSVEELALPGEHPELGPVTLSQLLATWVAHDLDHVVQIARTMAKQYKEATGPWPAYIRVLRD
ncbi:MAG TPA: DinB family protein [Gemmatimonadaceae bacterium]|jgi:hypothetical protein|nr:DinB family protein [Gemmatimonadaceae bacterium]